MIGYTSDTGKKRDLDEDSILVLHSDAVIKSEKVETTLLVVADGMGGHNAGEVASQLAVTGIAEKIVESMFESVDERMLEQVIKAVNEDIYAYVKENPEYKGMGTTVTAAVVQGGHVYIGHVGDTRVYLVNRGITQITVDHSLVQEMVEKGELTKEEARIHPQKNIITRAVGTYEDVEVDTFTEYIYGDDYLLLCCDGLTDMVPDEEIHDTVKQYEDPQEICDALVEKANDYGGFDNISVIIAQFEELPKRTDVLSGKTYIKDVDETVVKDEVAS